MSNYTPLSALDPTPPTTVPSAPVPRQSSAASAAAAAGAPAPAISRTRRRRRRSQSRRPPPRGGNTEFIDDIIAELNGTASSANAQDPGCVERHDLGGGDRVYRGGRRRDPKPGAEVADKGELRTFEGDGGGSDYSDAYARVRETDWSTTASSGRSWRAACGTRWWSAPSWPSCRPHPAPDRRVRALFVGDSVQATLLRAFAAMVVYVVVCRII